MKRDSITDAAFDPRASYSSRGLNVSFSLINEVVRISSSRFRLANSAISLYSCIWWWGSARVQTSIQPQGNSFTPCSSPELTQLCYLYMLNSMTGLSLSMGRARAFVSTYTRVCMCAIPPVWLTSLAAAVWHIERHLLLVKAFRTLGSSAQFLLCCCSYEKIEW